MISGSIGFAKSFRRDTVEVGATDDNTTIEQYLGRRRCLSRAD